MPPPVRIDPDKRLATFYVTSPDEHGRLAAYARENGELQYCGQAMAFPKLIRACESFVERKNRRHRGKRARIEFSDDEGEAPPSDYYINLVLVERNVVRGAKGKGDMAPGENEKTAMTDAGEAIAEEGPNSARGLRGEEGDEPRVDGGTLSGRKRKRQESRDEETEGGRNDRNDKK